MGLARSLARGAGLGGSLGITETLFATPAERALLTAIESALEHVEAGLAAELAFTDDLADTTARYLLDAGGKRVRPALVLLVAQLGAGATDEVLRAAQAVEMTHLASLYHDDVMDEAPLRRGIPSAHHVWGNSVAILTGDLLFARASKLVAGLGADALLKHATTFERLVLGQLHETVGPQPDEDAIAHYLQVLADKTGSLIALAVQLGLSASGAPDEYADALTEYGERVGVAFQLTDDVIDLSPRATETGKRAGTDLLSGVATYPVLLLAAQAGTDPAAAALADRLTRDVDDPDRRDDLDAAIAELNAHPVTEATRQEARRFADAAVAGLAPLPDGPVKKGLVRFAQVVVERDA